MPADCHELTIVAQCGGQFVENVLHFVGTAFGSASPWTDSDGLISDWLAAPQTNFLACCPDDYETLGYRAKRVNNTGGPTIIRPSSAAGTFGANTVTQGEGGVIISPYYFTPSVGHSQWRTGRLFVPGLPVGAAVAGELQVGYKTALDGLAGALGTNFGANNWIYAIWTKLDRLAYVPVTNDASGHIGTQRRRLKPGL